MKAIYTMLASEIEEDYGHWNDKTFLAELDKRSTHFKTGKVKGVAWEVVKAQLPGLLSITKS